MTVFIDFKKLHPDAVAPKQATDGAAGFDLVAVSQNLNNTYAEYGTGLAIQIPRGYVGYIHARSSISKTGWLLCNGVGVGDPDFTGEYKLRFTEMDDSHPYAGPYEIGDRIGQLVIVPCPQVKFTEVNELEDTTRGSGGFGSTGK